MKSVGKGVNRKTALREINGTQKKLLDVAIELFAANGFKGTSIRDIANSAGMTISNIYYYFGSKEGLLMALLEESTTGIMKGLRQVADRDIEPLERFRLLLKTHLNLLLDVYRKEAKILFLDEENLTRVSAKFQIEILNIYREELRELKSLGFVCHTNLTVLSFNIFGVLLWHLRWFRADGHMSLEQISEEMLRFVLHGVLAPHILESGA